jgi:cell division transport system ATP-binding protein
LLRTLYADLPLRAGSGEVAGFRLETIKPRDVPYLRRRVGIIFQDFQLFADRSVADNLLFVLRATGWRDSGKMKKRLAEVLMRVGLGLAGNRFPHQLSGGEQQRVVIARALLNEPLILFADEPTGNLDPEVAEGILQLFTEINRSGTAVLMATHNYELLQRHPSRIFKCEGNRLLDSRQEALALSGE